MRLVRVAVPVPSLEALTYSVPEEFADPTVGARVLVPLGNRTLTGIVVESLPAVRSPLSAVRSPLSALRSPLSALRSPLSVDDVGNEPLPGDAGAIKRLVDVLDDEAFLPPDVVRLALWVSEY